MPVNGASRKLDTSLQLNLEHFQDVSLLEVDESFYADTAFESRSQFSDIVLKVPKAGNLARVDRFIISFDSDTRLAWNFAIHNPHTSNSIPASGGEYGLNHGVTENHFVLDRR